MTKDERQELSVSKWRSSKGRGTLNLRMRFGKTRIANMIIDRSVNNHPDLKLLALAPNEITCKNLIENCTHCNSDNTMTSYKLMNKYDIYEDEIEVDLLVIDEAHKLLDGNIWEYINQIKYKWILCLTGVTLTEEQTAKLSMIGAPVIDVITEAEAIAEGWISPYVEYNLAVELEDHEKEKYAKYSQLISETLNMFQGVHKGANVFIGSNVFDSDFDLVMSCFYGKQAITKNHIKTFIKPDILRKIVADCQGWFKDIDITTEYGKLRNLYWNPDNIYERVKLFKQYVKNRNDILICNRSKINAVIEILNNNPVPTICFNESVELVDILFNHFPKESIAYHNAIQSRPIIDPATGEYYCTKDGRVKNIGKTVLKKLAIDGMKNGTYKYLFTVKSLNEGLTIENIEQVITTGGSTNPQTHDNRVARGKSLDYTNPNKVCTIINLYVDDFELVYEDSTSETGFYTKKVVSRDKQKLIERQNLSEQSPIWITELSHIL